MFTNGGGPVNKSNWELHQQVARFVMTGPPRDNQAEQNISFYDVQG